MTLSGEHVRTIRVGDGLFGIGACADMIAVCSESLVYLLSLADGSLIKSFGKRGNAVGQLDCCRCVQFTPDGQHIIIAECNNDRVSLFTRTGEFVRCIDQGLSRVHGVAVSSNGEILGAHLNGQLTVHTVLSPDHDYSLVRAFGKSVGETVAVSGDKVFVLAGGGVLNVFN